MGFSSLYWRAFWEGFKDTVWYHGSPLRSWECYLAALLGASGANYYFSQHLTFRTVGGCFALGMVLAHTLMCTTRFIAEKITDAIAIKKYKKNYGLKVSYRREGGVKRMIIGGTRHGS